VLVLGAAVSYTHLDVYKRQPDDVLSYPCRSGQSAWCLEWYGRHSGRFRSAFGWLAHVRGELAPVSYTHLDVYKRQDLSSYDRLFPTQDFMPKGSFGNLIALPLQGECRRRGTTVFLDPASLEPYADQWSYLASVPRISPEAVASLVETMTPVIAGPADTHYRRPRAQTPQQKPPETIHAVSRAMLEIDRIGVPPALLAALKHLASLHNPDYYEKERLRFSTWNTPRFLRCYGETMDRLLLPRGLRDHAERIVQEAGSTLDVVDACEAPRRIEVSLRAELNERQVRACLLYTSRCV